MRIFLVGKIDRVDWRHPLVKGLAEKLETLNVAVEGWPMMEGAIFGMHDFLGPYYTEIPKGAPESVKTHRLCLKGIDDSDLVYCWFDNVEAYASIFEMGYAHAKGKFTVTCYPKGFDRREFWFLSCCSDEFLEAESPAAGLINAMMKIVKSGRIKNPEVELERVQRNLDRMRSFETNYGAKELEETPNAEASKRTGEVPGGG